jgi:HPt (histidine-containing phosphotransfer) domain-containing protein
VDRLAALLKSVSVMEPQRTGSPLREAKIMSSSLIDIGELLARVENDRELMRELLLIFKEEFPQYRQALHDAVESLDAKRVASEAHTLKGMLSNLAAREVAGAAARLEQLGRSGETSEFAEALAAFDKLAKELLQQVDSVAEVPR